MKHLKTPQELNESSENLNISDVSDSDLYNFLLNLPKGHIDMVCVKNIELSNFFTHDIIEINIGDIITINNYAGVRSRNFNATYKGYDTYIKDTELFNNFKLYK